MTQIKIKKEIFDLNDFDSELVISLCRRLENLGNRENNDYDE